MGPQVIQLTRPRSIEKVINDKREVTIKVKQKQAAILAIYNCYELPVCKCNTHPDSHP